MILLQGNSLSRTFGDSILFDNIHITIQHDSRIALVGRNGTGKSTLLKILAGIEEASSGTVSRKSDISIGYLDQHAGIHSNRTIWEEMASLFDEVEQLKQLALQTAEELATPAVLNDPALYAQTLNRYDALQLTLQEKNAYGYESEIRSVLNGFHFYEEDYSRIVSTLSGGQRTRLALAKILLERHDLLILDEPTNHLDLDTLTWLEQYLKNSKSALLIVSHDQYFLDKVCTQVYEIQHHTAQHYNGNYSFYLEERALRFEQHVKAYEKQQKEIDKLQEFIDKNIVRKSTTKRAQSRRKQLEKMEKIERPKGDVRSIRFSFSTEKESGNQVLSVTDVAVGYDTDLCYPITFSVRKQDAIAIVGPNGVGKSTLLKSLLKKLPVRFGQVDYGTGVQIGYYDQNLSTLSSRNTVLDEIWNEYPTLPEQSIRSILGSFLFSKDDTDKFISQLSGGEKARVALAKLSLQHDNVLFLDEPTNHLDIDSKEVLEQALIDYDGTILFVSHDRYFINKVATSVIELSETGSTLYLGDYDYYIEKKKEQEELTALKSPSATPITPESPTSSKQSYLHSKDAQRKIRSLQRQIDTIEQKLAHVESDIQSVHHELAKEDVFTNYEAARSYQDQLHALEATQSELLQEWEMLSLELEELE